jgi:hypothetical protein
VSSDCGNEDTEGTVQHRAAFFFSPVVSGF